MKMIVMALLGVSRDEELHIICSNLCPCQGMEFTV